MSNRTLRVSDETHAKARELAQQHGLTLTGLVKVALDRFEATELLAAQALRTAVESLAAELSANGQAEITR